MPPLLWNLGAPGYFKDGFDRRIVHAERACVNPARTRHQGRRLVSIALVPAGGHVEYRLRLTRRAPSRRVP